MTKLLLKLRTPLVATLLRPIRSKQRVWHFSFHKNLTVYYKTVALALARSTGRNYKNFNSLIEDFQRTSHALDIASLNNHFIDLTNAPDNVRCSLFIRDPKDTIVSGYFYHKRGAEAWCKIPNPQPEDFRVVNGCIPPSMKAGESFQDCLNRLPLTEGLRAKFDFRRLHLQSLHKWMEYPPEFIAKYEDIIGNEDTTFRNLGRIYGLNDAELAYFVRSAAKNSARKRNLSHIRNPQSGQWRNVFPEELISEFREEFEGLLQATGYSVS